MSTKQGSETTQFQKGASGNPGGLTSEERQARDALRKWLAAETLEEGKAAYRQALLDGNPAIIKDWADRLLGKVKERVALEDGEGNAVSPLAIMLAQFRSLPPSAQDAIEQQLAAKAENE
jgi:hypothetical protein